MSYNAALAATLGRNANMLEHHLADFADAEMLVRPVPAANHAAWQYAHVVHFTATVARIVAPTTPLTLPPTLDQAAARESAAVDDPGVFPTKAELSVALRSATGALVDALARLDDARLAMGTPAAFQGFAPTVGELLIMVPMHVSMHVGQVQVIRRKLGKPLLF